MKDDILQLAAHIDQALDYGDANKLREALDIIEVLSASDVTNTQAAELYFFSANCYAGIRQLDNDANSLAWDNSALENEIYNLRLSLSKLQLKSTESDKTDLRYRVSTNLANALSHVGRFSEAIEIWDEVINLQSEFSMAIGNRGYCLCSYAQHLYDTGHQPIFFNESYKSIKKAKKIGLEKHAVPAMENLLDYLTSLGDWDEFIFDQPSESRGSSEKEIQYRSWCLDNRLFLNPLNDLWTSDIAANDVLTFPSIVVSVDEGSVTPPEAYGIYNQLKQEFVSARYILFEAIEDSNHELHFSDKSVKLYDMLDYRNYSLWIEKIKMAFLAAYAIFDKIAYLINEYWKLNLSITKVNFNNVWFEAASHKKGIASVFSSSGNWPLRGLYWTSKDLYYKSSSDQPIEPDARQLYYIRNHITHKCLKVYNHALCDTSHMININGHEASYPISDLELKYQATKLLKLVRNALIYVSLAAQESERKYRENSGEGLLGTMQLREIDEDYRF